MNGTFLSLGPDGFGPYDVQIGDGPIRLMPSSSSAEQLLVPGFVDIHIHGAFGIDFMTATSAEMLSLCEQLGEIGYETFLPTTVTATLEDVKTALSNLPDHPMVGGFHLEGPFISVKHPGAQPQDKIVDPVSAQEEWREVLEDERLKVVTLAPEVSGALDLARFLNARGVVVSMGHTDATFAEARAGFESGAQHTTHTFNAMRGLHHREAGAVGYALMNDALRCELIYDRHHVSPDAAELLIRNKPAGGVVAVSDSTMATGMASGEHLAMWGLDVVTSPGEVRLASNGALAGSAITLFDAFRNLAEDFGAELAVRACCLNPRQALRLLGPPSRYVVLDSRYEIVEVVEA
jgi:N-acetylglucosamine-6-phosphate deacetylase